ALRADAAQYSLRQGPAIAALQDAQLAVSSDVRDDDRWPDYGAQMNGLGIRAQAALVLRSGNQSVGALNLYSTRAEPFTVEALALARQYAGHASAAWDIIRRADRAPVPAQRPATARPLAS
ncbi:MAG: GAF domain-containing protein, partial [Nocardioidaceae bacterium]|nr:GAF domain-containing protein [Nocardioidaceae bacterium]